MAGFLSIAERKEFGALTGSNPRQRSAPPRIVLHTTETRSLPEYSSPPHFTIGVGHPGSVPSLTDGTVKIWQHVSLDKTAYALLHPAGTIETNHMGSHCIQIEMITFVGDQPKARIKGNRGDLPRPLLTAAAGLVREIIDTTDGISTNTPAPSKWSASGSFGAKAKQRFTDSEWKAFNGICGHEHVPHNEHWDPGALDIAAFVALVNGQTPKPRIGPPATEAPTHVLDSGWPKVLKEGDRHHRVVVVRGLLQALGYGNLSDSDLYTAEVSEALSRMQREMGIDVDGKWGPESHRTALAELANAVARADVTID